MTRRPRLVRTRRNILPRGFTLVEMLVTIVCLGLLIGIGLPAFQGFRLGSALNSAQQATFGAVQRARWSAINAGQTRQVDLSVNNIIAIKNGAGTTLATTTLTSFGVTHAAKDSANGAVTSITFDARGFVTSPATNLPVTVTLTNPLSATKTVVVNVRRVLTP